MRSGYMYMCPLDSDLYAVCPTRLWWAPWRWRLTLYRSSQRSGYFELADESPLPPMSKAECLGLMKIFGVLNLEPRTNTHA